MSVIKECRIDTRHQIGGIVYDKTATNHERVGYLVNLSLSGACIRFEKQFPASKRFLLWLPLNEVTPFDDIEISAKLIWQRTDSDEDGFFTGGVMFEKITRGFQIQLSLILQHLAYEDHR